MRIAIDGKTHVPTRVQVYAKNASKPSFEVAFTHFDPTTPSASVFTFNPPPGTTVTQEQSKPGTLEHGSTTPKKTTRGVREGTKVVGSGWTSVVVTKAPVSASDTSGSSSSGNMLGRVLRDLPKVSGAWGSGHLLQGHAVLGGAHRRRSTGRGRGGTRGAVLGTGQLMVGQSMADAAVRTTGLTKNFRHQVAVDSLEMVVPSGGVYGFLGPNGSGKTTTIRMLLGLVRPTAGSVELLGQPMPARSEEVLARVGALVEGPAFHPYLSGRQNLRRLEAADRTTDPRTATARVDAALDRVGLLAAATKRYRAYSLGMRQRLAIASALLRPRDLLVLDEPTNGLDPQGTREVRNLVGSLADGGTTVLVSSHLLGEVEQMCTHIGVMHVGKLVAQGTSAELRSGTEAEAVVETDQPAEAARIMRELGLSDVRQSPLGARGHIGSVAPEKVVAACVHQGVAVTGFHVSMPSLEDVFVALTGEGFDVSG